MVTLPHGAINWLKAMYALSERAAFGPPLFVSKRKARVAESHRRVAIVTPPSRARMSPPPSPSARGRLPPILF